jgi:hypothetical protein
MGVKYQNVYIYIYIGGSSYGGGDLIELAKDKVQWQGFVRTLMNLRFP